LFDSLFQVAFESACPFRRVGLILEQIVFVKPPENRFPPVEESEEAGVLVSGDVGEFVLNKTWIR
jgi:hypothetical protein